MFYEELKEALIEKGADAKLFLMPAVRERLERESISPDDIVINSDGTFNFGKCIMQRATIEREEEVAVQHEMIDPYGFDPTTYYTTYEKQKVSHDVLTIVETIEVD